MTWIVSDSQRRPQGETGSQSLQDIQGMAKTDGSQDA